ncbi:MAG: EAL domain-containing protein [Lachnospiraceae bacterium]|nr:EAL domain-containing protein [Lachnospiraceae bacterium]
MSNKQLYSILFMAVWAVVWRYLKKARKRKEPIADTFVKVLGWSLAAISSYILILITNRYVIGSFFYSVNFICMDWILFSLLMFSKEYTSKDYKKKSSGITVGKCILVADSVSLLCNVIFEHALSYKTVYEKGELFLILKAKTLYEVHLGICYVMCILLFWNLLHKAVKSPALYKRKYIISFLDLFLLVAMNGIFLLFQLKVDVSILFYSVAGVILYNSVFTYQPRHLLVASMSMAMNGVNQAFYIFDMEGECMWQNEEADQLSGKGKNLVRLCEEMQIQLESLSEDQTRKRIEWEQNEKTRYLEVQYYAMRDDNERYLGCFFIFHDITSDVEHSLRQEYLANFDQFTGIYNKYHFYEEVQNVLKMDEQGQYVLMVSDVGQMKFVNDTFGTKTGDEIIKAIADSIRRNVPEGAVYGRLESDKFAVLMKKQDFDETRFMESSDKILKQKNKLLPVKHYLGIYEIKDRTLPVDLMCDRAIMAVNTIKGSYHCTIAYYDTEYHSRINYERQIIADLPRALEEEEFQIYLQPQINHDTKEIVGAEALVRWIHKKKGMIPPSDFIPVFEKNGLIAKLDEYVWDKACAILKEWKQKGRDNWSISVNISPKDLYFMDIYSVIKGLVEKHQISPSVLKLELTETSFVNDVKQLISLIADLKELGFKVEMDDFGSGYSALNILKDIPVDILKMDMRFFEYTDNEDRSAKILSAVVEMAKRLKIPVIAEGVEDLRQADYLSSIGCSVIQGYLYARPMPLEEFEQFITEYPYRDILAS